MWFVDAMDNPKKYDGKVVKFNAMVYKPPKYPNTCFVPGRFAMTCCADDISLWECCARATQKFYLMIRTGLQLQQK